MRILRHPWTSDLSETLISRIFEQYLRGNHPNVEIRYIGRDFPLFGEEDKTIADKRESLFTGSFTQDPPKLSLYCLQMMDFCYQRIRQLGKNLILVI